VIRLADDLEPFARVLRTGGFRVDGLEPERLGPSLVAETPHALVLCTRCTWETLEATVDEAQAELTHLSARHPSARSWDLYLVVSIAQSADEAHEIQRERVEHDTRYARKFVVAGPTTDDEALQRALRPLLPLRPTDSVHLDDPLAAMRDQLLAGGQDAEVIERALASFRSDGEVEVP
jgi:hypothetical protein